MASLEREIGKVVGDANVIENSDVCTESVSISLEPILRGNASLIQSYKLCEGRFARETECVLLMVN